MKGVIVAADYGSRFFPITKIIPKEMMPLINKPVIDFIIQEFIASRIDDGYPIAVKSRNQILNRFTIFNMLMEAFNYDGLESSQKNKNIRYNSI